MKLSNVIKIQFHLLCNYRVQEGCQRSNLAGDISEKDQRFIDEVVRRVASGKSKLKPKSRSSCSERTTHSSMYQSSPRDKGPRTARDQASYLKESKR